MDIRNLGNFASIDAVWARYPNGGQEGDYLTIAGVKYRWNKYILKWENAEVVTETSGRESTTFSDLHVQNDVIVGGDVKVNGTLRAEHVKQPNVGLFATLADLQAAYPTPEVGMWAVVGDSVPGAVYRCTTEGVWSATGGTGGVDELENVLLYSQQTLNESQRNQVLSNLGLTEIVNDYIFKGVVTPSTTISAPDANVFWIGGAGTYTQFGGTITIAQGNIGLFTYNGSYTRVELPIAYFALKRETGHGKNLFDPDDVESGYLNANGTITPYANCITSAYIPVLAGQSITCSPRVRFFLAYDTGKTPISGSYYSAPNPYPPYTYTAESDGYVRVSFVTNDVNKMVEYGASVTYYEPYYERDYVQEGVHLSETMLGDVDNILGSYVEKVEKQGKNLYNTEEADVGYFLNNSGTLTASATYTTSGYIPIRAGQSVSCSPRVRFLCAYDSNQQLISESYYSAPGPYPPYIYTAQEDGYIKVTFFSSDQNKQIEYGNTVTDYEPFIIVEHIEENVHLSDTMKEDVEDFLGGYVKKVVEPSKNLYNPDDAVSGYLNANGTVTAYEIYVTSAYIPVLAGQSITCSPRVRYLIAYDSTRVAISESYFNAVSPYTTYTYTAQEDGYVRVTFPSNDTNIMIEYGSSVTDYEPYGDKNAVEANVHLSEAMVEDVENIAAISHLTGKKWIHCGDSFSDYTNKTYSEGVFSGKSESYPRLIAIREKMSLNQEFMLSGRTMAYPSDGTFTNSLTCPSAVCYYQNIPADADYITIMLGINDLHHLNGSGTTPDGEDATGVITLGTIDSIDTSTYLGAYNVVLNWLRANRPFAHVGIIVTNGLGNSETARGYKDGQIALAKKYGYPYLDLNGDQFTPAMNRFCNENMAASLYNLLDTLYAVDAAGGNTHPNWQAHEYESVFIGEWLKRI